MIEVSLKENAASCQQLSWEQNVVFVSRAWNNSTSGGVIILMFLSLEKLALFWLDIDIKKCCLIVLASNWVSFKFRSWSLFSAKNIQNFRGCFWRKKVVQTQILTVTLYLMFKLFNGVKVFVYLAIISVRWQKNKEF